MCQGSSHDVQARLFFPLLFPPPDIKTLFYAENERRQAAGGQEAALTVNIPQWCELETNYRTHQGILDSAALMVVSSGQGVLWDAVDGESLCAWGAAGLGAAPFLLF